MFLLFCQCANQQFAGLQILFRFQQHCKYLERPIFRSLSEYFYECDKLEPMLACMQLFCMHCSSNLYIVHILVLSLYGVQAISKLTLYYFGFYYVGYDHEDYFIYISMLCLKLKLIYVDRWVLCILMYKLLKILKMEITEHLKKKMH